MNRQSDMEAYKSLTRPLLLCGKYLHDLTKLSGFNVCLLIWKKPLASELGHAIYVTYAHGITPSVTETDAVRLCHLQHKFCSLQPVVVLSVM